MDEDLVAARKRCRRQQRDLLIICGGIVLAACLLAPPSDDSLGLFGLSLPPLCPSRSILGINCPGCGLTRSFVCMGHGLWSEAFHYHRVGPLAFVYVAAQIPYRIWCYRRGEVLEQAWLMYLPLGIIGLMFVNWIIVALSGGLFAA